MRRRTFRIMGLAVGCGLLAAFAVSQLSGPQDSATVQVLVPVKDLPAATVLDDIDSMFTRKPFARDNVPAKVINDPEALRGKATAHALTAGLPITENNLYSPRAIHEGLQIGFRAMTVRASTTSALHGFVQPGAHVDVICTTRLIKEPNVTMSKIFLQNISVLAVNQHDTPLEKKATVANPVSVTLMVTPEQAQRLYLVSSRSIVGLALRKHGDDQIVKLKGATNPLGNEDVQEMTTVPVALRDLEPGTLIDQYDDFFREMELPASQVGENIITNRSDLEGQIVCRFLAKDQRPAQANFIGVRPTEPALWRMTIIQGTETNFFDFSVPVPETAPLPKGPSDCLSPQT